MPNLSRDQVKALAVQLLEDARTRPCFIPGGTVTGRGREVGHLIALALRMAGITDDEREQLREELVYPQAGIEDSKARFDRYGDPLLSDAERFSGRS